MTSGQRNNTKVFARSPLVPAAFGREAKQNISALCARKNPEEKTSGTQFTEAPRVRHC